MYNEKMVLDCNHNFANMFGYTKEAAMKMSLINFVDWKFFIDFRHALHLPKGFSVWLSNNYFLFWIMKLSA